MEIVKRYGWVLLLFFVAILGVGISLLWSKSSEKEQSNMTNTKDLGHVAIVYYSYTGTNRQYVKILKQLTDGDVFEIKAQDPYDSNSNVASDRVFKERRSGNLPVITGQKPDLSNYDTILIGTPVWNDSMANPIMTYLRDTNFQDKRVAPYWTYITSQGQTRQDFQKQIRNAKQEKGLALRTSLSDKQLQQSFGQWLNRMRK